MVNPLRKCRHCGLEAWTEEDLEKFVISSECRHGRRNSCKPCRNIYTRNWDKENPLSSRYAGMISRCYNPIQTLFHNYGGRGITVCDEWRNDMGAFVKWAKQSGFEPELQIDRIDNDGSYSPKNCRWVTPQQQALNRRDTVTFPEKGTRICSRCRVEKPFSEFYSDRSSTYGYGYLCKDCAKKHMREYRERKKLGKKP